MKLSLLIWVNFMLCCSIGLAQSTVKGKVKEQHTDVMLSGITVENQTQHITTHTTAGGLFTIQAKKGDILCFAGLNYVPDTVYLTDTKNMLVLLQLRSNQLDEVKVTEQGLDKKGTWTAPAEKGLLGSKTVFTKSGGGLKVKLFGANTGEKNRKKLEQLELNGERERQIASIFSAANMKNYIPITGQELTNFLIKYTPDVATYHSPKFNITEYISTCYKDFLTIPEDKRKSKTYFQLDGG